MIRISHRYSAFLCAALFTHNAPTDARIPHKKTQNAATIQQNKSENALKQQHAPQPEETELDPVNLNRYFWANFQQQRGDLPAALAQYKKIFTNNGSPYAYKWYTNFLYTSGNFPVITQLAPKIEAIYGNDIETVFLIAQSLERQGKVQEADKRFIELHQKNKAHAEIAYFAANTYIRRKELDNALFVINNVLNNAPRKPSNFIFYFLQAQIYITRNDKTHALESVNHALELHPGFEKGLLLKAILEGKVGVFNKRLRGHSVQKTVQFVNDLLTC